MTDDFDVEDVAAMREQGDLREFLRSRIRRPTGTPPAPAPPRLPGHRPGAWPPGAGPTPRSEPPAITPEWTAALDDYRQHLLTELHDEEDPA
ncbi:hypothetical protein [Streptomyces boncukensis]|uniref:Uncharacterized protein n=1 Tax=Streptomyces boncukensis TaxID=2711219 RepID=A0A6G4X9F0_9ACTN|nr:hypothetical protein [Streptomyces boncukensis]NGO73467.1 hypothetical protein [Streptomyces boncukensis]